MAETESLHEILDEASDMADVDSAEAPPESDLSDDEEAKAPEPKFWTTQPVPQIDDPPFEGDGPIQSIPSDQVSTTPAVLPDGLQWSFVDITQTEQLLELYHLLANHYVEDPDEEFRFNYSPAFLTWALKPPNYVPDWLIGIRSPGSNALVAFISGIPLTLNIRGNIVKTSEFNFLCIHRKFRLKRLTPALVSEFIRQSRLKGVVQSFFTAGAYLFPAVSECRYFHRPLNFPRLVNVGFSYVPASSSMSEMVERNKVPTETSLPGLREMDERDVPAVKELLTKYLTRFDMVPVFSKEEIHHTFVAGRGIGDRGENGRRKDQSTCTYVVENPETHEITEFFSLYHIPSTVLDNEEDPEINVGYLSYYASTAAFEEDAEGEDGKLKHRLTELIQDALVIAKQQNFDVMNALTLMDNNSFLRDLKFTPGTGILSYYLYNWKTKPLSGYTATDDRPIGRGVGVIML
ncbi:Glycylpeptide N-tetradecanoyltransferase [Sistotremastrum suecicum HHB10207 ss-3]|uniref:Glycylpeptide N-tetradecanoyltransferase n=1 Tax=Sistotremastrum suecicum HHB10207 ss-3 TaxID=1314776 RepID=A0A166FNC7_9AGAM|nr:Glycylpeptide N-tetradecanoyltransferase [Sistotremastrum suecicum HHB10207 ss-3]